LGMVGGLASEDDLGAPRGDAARLVFCWFNQLAVRVCSGHAYSFCCCD
jgi:hypothetical protein